MNLYMQGSKWWMKGSDPFQVLACCFEYTSAVDSGDPKTYVSHLPIHQVCWFLFFCFC